MGEVRLTKPQVKLLGDIVRLGRLYVAGSYAPRRQLLAAGLIKLEAHDMCCPTDRGRTLAAAAQEPPRSDGRMTREQHDALMQDGGCGQRGMYRP